MAKKRGKDVEEPNEADSDLTPMIDVTFLLLIFFVLNIKFKTEEGEIESYLPKNRGQGSGTPQIDLSEVRLKLLWYSKAGSPTKNDNGTVIVKIDRKAYNGPGDLDSPDWTESSVWDNLLADLQGYKENYKGTADKGLPVIIDAREQVPYKYVVRALNEVVKTGLKDVTFAAPEKPYREE